ncbi:MAG TPA: peroxiredoxin family protein, partial [Planctomycetaceae bacterium]|nr:peroxiredoxin family protein [Planctomycetaceae bacterium]
GIAHMWHMSGHIFSDLARYADAAWQQEASARVDHAYMHRDHVLPDQIHNYAHNNEWLIRDLSYVGRVRDALALARNLIEIPRHPLHNVLSGGKSAHFGRMRLFEVLSRYELDDELIALCETTYLEPTEIPAEQVNRIRHLGAAFLRKGEIERGLSLIAELEQRLKKERYRLNVADSPPPAGPLARGESPAADEFRPDPVLLPMPEDDGRLKPLELAIDELKGRLAVAQGDYRAGVPLLQRSGGVNPVYLARIEFLAGNREAALKMGRDALASHKNEVQPLAEMVDLLWQAGEQKEAGERFHELRESSGKIDLEIPVFARLAPIAAALNLPNDWRIVKPPSADVGERPPLDSLGPFLWQPSLAPEWTLPDAEGRQIALSQYRGKPVVVIFYLGYQCLHCAEQLQAFAPLAKEFEDAGISIVAISSDDQQGLAKSVENYKPGAFPFPLAADPSLDTFKAYRAHDDFESRPLHATIFVDAEGLDRWHDISFEPFRDARFVLNEARRLLAISATQSSPANGKSIAKTGAADAAPAAGEKAQ